MSSDSDYSAMYRPMYQPIASGEWWNANQQDSPQSQWGLIAEAYKNAADQLVSGSPDPLLSGSHRVYIAVPIMFLYRHYLELKLKAILIDLGELKSRLIDLGEIEEQTIPGLPSQSHSLLPVWQAVKELIIEIDQIDQEVRDDEIEGTGDVEMLDAIGERIEEFNSIDATSMSFRYPTDRTGEKRILASLPDRFQLSQVKNTIDALSIGLGGIEMWAGVLRDTCWEMERELSAGLDYP